MKKVFIFLFIVTIHTTVFGQTQKKSSGDTMVINLGDLYKQYQNLGKNMDLHIVQSTKNTRASVLISYNGKQQSVIPLMLPIKEAKNQDSRIATAILIKDSIGYQAYCVVGNGTPTADGTSWSWSIVPIQLGNLSGSNAYLKDDLLPGVINTRTFQRFYYDATNYADNLF